MALVSEAPIELTTFGWVPPFARGQVRDLRVRWALEEAGLDYGVRTVGPIPSGYEREQPFCQVPAYREGELQLFESGAIVQHIGERDERLLPREPVARARAVQWTYAALSSVEPFVMAYAGLDAFYPGEEWAKLRRPSAKEELAKRLGRVAEWLGSAEWLEGDRFTIGDLMMVSILRIMGDEGGPVANHPALAAYRARGLARPAFQRALADQLALYADKPKGEAA
ncbi:glutathione S-transferase family protein [Sphingomonas sp. BN140010]|uniref:Glutathione S-transferase family protein n=1 Tax=Sphingomonas arvum TaxID=2992113 RepID=A0ABT3JG90_9SPHN|nr:glutathione S-transferase family protein [Sphingomonas sp. BN140010]MCW3797944.1 glutathione S-transferase family protein [Sphingomonas sp. BN140010]